MFFSTRIQDAERLPQPRWKKLVRRASHWKQCSVFCPSGNSPCAYTTWTYPRGHVELISILILFVLHRPVLAKDTVYTDLMQPSTGRYNTTLRDQNFWVESTLIFELLSCHRGNPREGGRGNVSNATVSSCCCMDIVHCCVWTVCYGNQVLCLMLMLGCCIGAFLFLR